VKWFLLILEAVLRVLIPVLEKSSQAKMQDAGPQPELRERLRARVRGHWGAAMVVLALLCLTGCGARTIYVPDGEPVRLRETIKGAKVWVLGSDGQPVAGSMDLPEGWYCLAVPKEE
jgi:hypothetical protein